MKNNNCYSGFLRNFYSKILAVICFIFISSACWANSIPVYGLNGYNGVTGYNPTTGAVVSSWSGTLNSTGSIAFDVTVVPLPAAFWLFSSGLIGMLGIMRRCSNKIKP